MTRVPSPARRAWIVAVALACVLLVVFVLYRREPLDSTSATPPTETVEAAERLAQSGVDAPVKPTSPPEAGESREAPQQDTKVEARKWTNITIEGRVRIAGIEGDLPEFTLQFSSESGSAGQQQCRTDGSFSSKRNAKGEEWLVRHTVRVMFGEMALQDFTIEPSQFVHDESTGTWLARVEFTLTSVWIVRGRLLGDFGVAPNDGAATLLVLESGKVPSRVLGAGRTSDDGRFEFAATRDVASTMLILQAPGYLPQKREVSFPPSGVLECGDVVLRRGATLSGCIESSLPPEYRANSVTVRSSVEGASDLTARTLYGLQWADGNLSWDAINVAVGDLPCFDVSGLEEAEYAIWPQHVGMISLVRVTSSFYRAPASGLVLHDSGAVIRLAVRLKDGDALSETELRSARLTCNDAIGRPIDHPLFGNNGVLPVLAPAHFRLQARVRADGFETSEFEVAAPSEGGVVDFTVELRRLPKPRPLTVEVVREDGSVMDMAGISIETEGPRGWEPSGGTRDRSETGRYVLPNVPATRVRLTVEPDWTYMSSGKEFSQRVQLVLDETSPDTLRVVLPAGGLFELDVTDPDGAPVTARCTLSHEGVALDETMFIDRSGSNSMFGGWVGSNGSARNLWPLPGGDYMLHVEFDGFVAQDLPLKIVPKSTVHHALQLQRAP